MSTKLKHDLFQWSIYRSHEDATQTTENGQNQRLDKILNFIKKKIMA